MKGPGVKRNTLTCVLLAGALLVLVIVGCALCHKEIRIDAAPQSHRMNWDIVHGQMARKGEDEIAANKCYVCHRRSSCIQCHQDEKPKSHTNHWRHRGHGIASAIDRSACFTCHNVDYCQRCHQETSPRDHTPSWGSPLSRHCLTCHYPLSSMGCQICHKAMPDHANAPDRPSNVAHSAGNNCRLCHIPGAGLTHPDNGDNCEICHR